MKFYEKALQEIKNTGEKGQSIGELTKKLKIKTKFEKRQLAKTIKQLIKSGLVVGKGKNKFSCVSKEGLIKGKLKGHRRGFAFLIREDGGEDIFIPNKALNGAMHGDIVLVGLTGPSEGVVLSVEERGVSQLTGTFVKHKKYGFVIPDNDNYFRDVFIPSDLTANAPPYSKVVVKVDNDFGSKGPTGTIIDILGMAGDKNAEALSILRGYDFDDKFPPEVLKEAQKIKFVEQQRKDLTDLLTITIDGDDAKDFDDAISVEKTENGYKLYVHIADVSHYVKEGSILDREALERATSVYFPGGVFPMLPETISNGVCSLRPNEKKFTITVVMDIDKKGDVKNARFYETLTMSDYRMTYDEVAKILDGDKKLVEKYNKLIDMINLSKELADIIYKKRKAQGSIDFGSKESKIILDSSGDVIDVYPYIEKVSNSIIEQFMVLTNETVAEYLSKRKLPAIYRVHDEACGDKLEMFVQFIKGLGYQLDMKDGIKPQSFSKLLEEVKGKDEEPIVNKVMLRTMQKAIYSTKNSGHFGLSLENYCHFTSPIRRYPDLMVHRVLKAVINDKADEKFKQRYQNLCENAAKQSTEREIASAMAERDVDDYYKAIYMTKHIGECYKGIISGIVNSGIFVTLENTVEGFLSIDDLPDDRYLVDDKNYCVKGVKYNFSLSDKINVKIKASDPDTRNVDLVFDGEAKNHLKK